MVFVNAFLSLLCIHFLHPWVIPCHRTFSQAAIASHTARFDCPGGSSQLPINVRDYRTSRHWEQLVRLALHKFPTTPRAVVDRRTAALAHSTASCWRRIEGWRGENVLRRSEPKTNVRTLRKAKVAPDEGKDRRRRCLNWLCLAAPKQRPRHFQSGLNSMTPKERR